MRGSFLACILLAATPALAQKPPPLGAPDDRGRPPPRERNPEPSRPFADVPSGKPPPLGANEPDGRRNGPDRNGPDRRGPDQDGPERVGPDRGPDRGGPDRNAPDRNGPDRNGPDRAGPDNDELPGPRQRAQSSGTGFVVAEGRVLTNNHVVNECGRMVARNAGGTRVLARVQATDRGRDLALLIVPATLGPALTFREAPAVRRGENVVTYGFPLSGLLSSGPSLTTGNISALAGIRDNPGNFQISAAVQPGNSGGPLFDSQANVIGVVVSKLNAARVAEMTGGDIPQNVNFAVKGSEALAFLRQNGVQPRTATSATGTEKRADEIDAVANPSTVYLQCYR